MILESFHIGLHQVKYFHGAFWLKIFYHNMSTSVGFFNEEEALLCETSMKYSLLQDLDDTYKINGKFEFLLEYPELGEYNRWKQLNNPLLEIEDGAQFVKGYEDVHIGVPSQYCGGLARCKGEVAKQSLLNGSPKITDIMDWTYSIGMYNGVTWNGFTKLPANGGDREFNEVYLWSRIPHCKFSYAYHQNQLLHTKILLITRLFANSV